tara:strand:+ start:203 stop:589 length:387 start_codon:yes stop_codon:yes gene_type:complete
MNTIRIQPNEMALPAANYAHAVLVNEPRKLLYTSGVVPVKDDGTVPDSIGDQAEVIWNNLIAILVEAGMDLTDIVSVTTYVVPSQDLSAVMAARDKALNNHLAASTLLVVAELAQPSWKMEVAVVAAC